MSWRRRGVRWVECCDGGWPIAACGRSVVGQHVSLPSSSVLLEIVHMVQQGFCTRSPNAPALIAGVCCYCFARALLGSSKTGLRARKQLLLQRLELLGSHAVGVGLVTLALLLRLLELCVRVVHLGNEGFKAQLLRKSALAGSKEHSWCEARLSRARKDGCRGLLRSGGLRLPTSATDPTNLADESTLQRGWKTVCKAAVRRDLFSRLGAEVNNNLP